MGMTTTLNRTLGLPATPERAAMAYSYEAYASAQLRAVKAHNAWRRMSRLHAPDDRRVKGALTRATNAALSRAGAKSAYHQARRAAELAAA